MTYLCPLCLCPRCLSPLPRFRKLQHTVLDPQRLKTLTGGWFKELWSKRHKRLGSDIVQASIRRKKKPNGGWLTLYRQVFALSCLLASPLVLLSGAMDMDYGSDTRLI